MRLAVPPLRFTAPLARLHLCTLGLPRSAASLAQVTLYSEALTDENAADVWLRGPAHATLQHRVCVPTPGNVAPDVARAGLVANSTLDVVGQIMTSKGVRNMINVPGVLVHVVTDLAFGNRVPVWSSRVRFPSHPTCSTCVLWLLGHSWTCMNVRVCVCVCPRQGDIRAGHGEMKPSPGVTVMDGVPQAALMFGGLGVCSRQPVERWWRSVGGISRVIALMQSLPGRGVVSSRGATGSTSGMDSARIRAGSTLPEAEEDGAPVAEAQSADGLAAAVQLVGYLLRCGLSFREEVR